MRLHLVSVLTFSLTAVALSAQSPLYTVNGAVGNRLGWSVDSAGDVNGDNFGDFVAGAPLDDTMATDAGRAEVISGADGSVLYEFFGSQAEERFGRSVSGAGDVNGDGFDDVLIGAPGDSSRGIQNGAAYVFSGADGSQLHAFFGVTNDSLGLAVAAAGDVNRDGYDDVIVGGPEGPTPVVGPGYAAIYSGVDGTAIRFMFGDAFGDNFGFSVSNAGDIDGDDIPDAIVGGPQWRNGAMVPVGIARVFSGANGSVLQAIEGQINQDRLGFSVSGAGDVDNDGTPDVIVGVPGWDMPRVDAGRATVYSGADWSELHSFTGGPLIGSQLGHSVDGAGDVNGDDFADVIVGSPYADRGAVDNGRAGVYSGQDGSNLLNLIGVGAGHLAGWSVAGAGDVNRDGFADVIVGTVSDNEAAPFAGSAKVYAGQAYRRHDAGPDITGTPGAGVGAAVARVADVDGDMVDELLVGAPGDSDSGLVANGSATLYSGDDLTEIFTVRGDASGDRMGSGVADAGDVNNDGTPDFVVGAIDASSGAGLARVYSGTNGAVLQTFNGTAAGDALGTAAAGLGDVDGDSFGDVAVGAPGASGSTGEVQVFSGQTGALLYSVQGGVANDFFGRSIANVGDLDGDAISDFIVGAPQLMLVGPGYAQVLSGVDGKLIHPLTGTALQNLFGWAVCSAGDFDGDSVPDFAVGAPLGFGNRSGYVRVFSGVDAAMVRQFNGFEGEELGSSVALAGDVNGDGFDDVIAGAQLAVSAGPATGAAYVHSLFFYDPIQVFEGAASQDFFGSAVTGLGDTNGDGLSDLAVGASFAGGGDGLVRVFNSVKRLFPGDWADYGAACETSMSTLSRIGLSKRPAIGTATTLTLATSRPSTGIVMLLDAARVALPLDFIGMPGCTLLALPTLTLPNLTDPSGSAGLPLPIPNNTAYVGVSLYFQWLIIDPGGTPLGLVASNGLELRFGNP